MNEAQVSIKVRNRLNLPAVERPRLMTMINAGLMRLARQTANDPTRRHLVETDRTSVTASITNTNQEYYADLGTVISTNGVLIDLLKLGTVWHTYAAKTFVNGDVNLSTDIITVSGHNFPTGLKVRITSDGVFPSGISPDTDYFIINLTSSTLALASSLANAHAGTKIDITAVGGINPNHTITAWEANKVQWIAREGSTLTRGLPVTYIYGWIVDDRLYTSVTSGTFSFTVPAVPTLSSLHAKLDEDLIDVICDIYKEQEAEDEK